MAYLLSSVYPDDADHGKNIYHRVTYWLAPGLAVSCIKRPVNTLITKGLTRCLGFGNGSWAAWKGDKLRGNFREDTGGMVNSPAVGKRSVMKIQTLPEILLALAAG